MASVARDGDMSPAEHLNHAHAHLVSAGVHADLAATHIQAAKSDGDDGGDGSAEGYQDYDRSAPAAAGPQAGYAQNRTGFAARTGAVRTYRAATGRR